ncbi:AP-1 complex subunit beta-1 [Kappamyces sp. JEL0680]|nr:AP-1 complex subunit beta-1 [Kappamyces sp. JEL0680]
MSDAKFFTRGKVQELQADLQEFKKDPKYKGKKQALKKVIANMTMGNDMSALSAEMLGCLSIPDVEVKKMIYLFIVTYAQQKPDIAIAAINQFITDTRDDNPLIRSLAIRNMSNIPVEKVWLGLCEPLRRALVDKDPYVAKTAALAVAKLYSYNSDVIRSEGLLDRLKNLLQHENANVVANAVLALMEIANSSSSFVFSVDVPTANKLLTALEECSEWSQAYLLEAVMTVVPDDPMEAELLADRISPRLQHSNSGVVIGAVRLIVYLSSFLQNGEALVNLLKKCGPPLVTLLHAGQEVQFVALRNIQLILQKYQEFLRSEIKVFFCKYNDPIYVKLAKLEIMFQMADESNVFKVLPELKEYSSEVDVDFVRKSVRSIGRCAVKIESSADKCVEILVDLVQTKVDYVVQEAIVVIKDIFRKYPNRFESIIRILCENLASLEEPEAKSSMIWIIGQYSDRIENADELLSGFLDNFKEEATAVQLSLLTAVVKLFIKRPAAGQVLVPRILKYSTEEVDNPDLRDRGFIYWRLLSTDPVAAKTIIFGDKPPINTETDKFDASLLSRLLYNISTLSSLSHRPTVMNSELASQLLTQFNHSARLIEAHLAVKPTASPVRSSATESAKAAAPMVNPYRADGDWSPDTKKPNITNDLDRLTLLDDRPASPGTKELYGNSLPLDLFSGNYASTVQPSMDRSPSPDIFALGPQKTTLPGMSAAGYLNGQGAPAMNPITPQLAASAHNPFAAPSQAPVPKPLNTVSANAYPNPIQPIGMAGLNPAQSQMTEGGNPLQLDSIQNAVLDPFAKNSQFRSSSPSPTTSEFAPPRILLLNPQMGRGLEISGSFSRRNGVVYLNMAFSNRSSEPLREFAILFNKNSFGLVPAQPLSLGPQLFPNQSIETSLPLKVEGLPTLSNPINNIQVAVKNNAGIVYFQTLLPLHVLFREGGGIPQQTWLQYWNQDITTPEFRSLLSIPNQPIPLVKRKLESHSFYVVAERQGDGKHFLYGACTLDNGSVFLGELQIDALFRCSVACKTFAPHLSEAFNLALVSILQQP